MVWKQPYHMTALPRLSLVDRYQKRPKKQEEGFGVGLALVPFLCSPPSLSK